MAFGLFDLAQGKLAHVFETWEAAEKHRVAADVKTLVHAHVDDETGETTETPVDPKPAQEEVAVTPVVAATEETTVETTAESTTDEPPVAA